MLQNYLELNALISLDVHTERTLLMIECALLQFNDVLKILRVNHQMLAAKLLRQHIDSQNLLCNDKLESRMTDSDTGDINDKIGDTQAEHSYQPMLGTSCDPTPMQTFEVCNATNSAFTGIRKKFAEFLNSSVCAWGYENTSYIKIPLGL
ncbi:hypothetical protein JVU11DRAFT_3 [Chiua virens]|nr:hypothetical protein JVU11DRAFT_3 [Chiua virens]